MANWLNNSPFRWAYKPPPAQSRVNWNHPLSRGLRRLYLMNEGGGGKVNDLCAGDAMTLNGNIPWQPGKDGICLLAGSTSTDYALNGQTLNLTTATVAVTMLYQSIVPNSGTRYIAGFCQGNNGATFDKVLLYDVVNGGLRFLAYDGATKETSGVALSANTWYTLAGTADGTNIAAWVNGVSKATAACGNTFAGYTGANLMIAGAPLDITDWGFQTSLFAVWDRALTAKENAQYAANPYALIAPPTTRRFFVTSSNPAVPTGLALTVNSSTQITATWNAVSGATSYDLQYDLTNAFASPTTINTASPPVTAQPLTPSTTYYFRVRADNGAGNSAYSSAVSATTPAASKGGNSGGVLAALQWFGMI